MCYQWEQILYDERLTWSAASERKSWIRDLLGCGHWEQVLHQILSMSAAYDLFLMQRNTLFYQLLMGQNSIFKIYFCSHHYCKVLSDLSKHYQKCTMYFHSGFTKWFRKILIFPTKLKEKTCYPKPSVAFYPQGYINTDLVWTILK